MLNQVRLGIAEERARNVVRNPSGLTVGEQREETAAYVATKDIGGAIIAEPRLYDPIGAGATIEALTGWNPAKVIRDWHVRRYLRKSVEVERQRFPDIPPYRTYKQGP